MSILTSWVELGTAIALQKKIFLFRDDRRNSNDCESYPLNTMIFSGLSERGWKNHFYRSVDEIRSPEKALAQWLSGAGALCRYTTLDTLQVSPARAV